MSDTAVLFAGQGSQRPGMGRALFESFPESRAVFEAADEALGAPLSRTCFEGTEAELSLTETTQPAVLTVAVAALRALEARGFRPAAGAGHSLGEYGAHVAAETFAFADAVRVVRLRGRFMQEAVPVGVGAMAAILGLAGADVERACAEAAEGRVVAPANWNGPDQTVISGHADAVARAMDRARAAGAKRALPLPVSAPFHSRLMEPAAERLRAELARIRFSDPKLTVYSNVDARPVHGAADAREKLVRQVVASVRWHEQIEAMVDAGIHTFIEVGPGNVLAGLVRRIRKEVRVFSVGDPEGVAAAIRGLGVAA